MNIGEFERELEIPDEDMEPVVIPAEDPAEQEPVGVPA
jgi:hypothetical protein